MWRISPGVLHRGAWCDQGQSIFSVWEVTAIKLVKGEKSYRLAEEKKSATSQQRTGTPAGLIPHFTQTHLDTSVCFPLADCDHFSISANFFCCEKKNPLK